MIQNSNRFFRFNVFQSLLTQETLFFFLKLVNIETLLSNFSQILKKRLRTYKRGTVLWIIWLFKIILMWILIWIIKVIVQILIFVFENWRLLILEGFLWLRLYCNLFFFEFRMGQLWSFDSCILLLVLGFVDFIHFIYELQFLLYFIVKVWIFH